MCVDRTTELERLVVVATASLRLERAMENVTEHARGVEPRAAIARVHALLRQRVLLAL